METSQPLGFLAVPPTGTDSGVLVLHAWWGLNDTIKAFCTQLAESGFVTFAPDLYHGKVADTIAEAEALGQALDANHLQAKADPAHICSVVIFYGTGARSLTVQEPLTSVTLPRMMSLSHRPTSIIWRKRSSVPVAR